MVRTRVDQVAGQEVPVILCSSTRCQQETRDSDADGWIWADFLNIRNEIHAWCSPRCVANWAYEQLSPLVARR